MSRDGMLGAFEEQVLLALAHLGEGAYGMTVRREIQARTDQDVAIGAVYATLDRLEAKGLIASRLGGARTDRRRRARRFVRLRPKGVEALRSAHEVRRRMWDGLDPEKIIGRRGAS